MRRIWRECDLVLKVAMIGNALVIALVLYWVLYVFVLHK